MFMYCSILSVITTSYKNDPPLFEGEKELKEGLKSQPTNPHRHRLNL